MPAAARKPADLAKERAALARELVTIHRKHSEAFLRIDDLKAQLKKMAGDLGENFKEEFPGLGAVKVSAPKDKRCKGTAPEIVVEAFLGLPERRREKLLADGIVVVAEQWTSPYYGSVSVDLF